MILSEAVVIRGLWFRPGLHDYGLKLFSVPFEIAVPFVLGSAFRMTEKKRIATGAMNRVGTIQIDLFFGSFLMTTYLCISTLANLAF
jgi:hypothetical protein